MGDFDVAVRRLVAWRPADFLRLVLGRTVRVAEVLEPRLPGSEVVADSAVLTDDGLLVHTEFQTRWEPDLADRMLEYRVALRRSGRNRGARAMHSAVVFLTARRYPGPGNNRLDETGPDRASRLAFEYQEVRLWEIPARAMLETGDPGLLPLVPLGGGAESAMLEEAVRSARAVPDRTARADLLAGLRILGGLTEFGEVLRAMITKKDLYELSETYREDIDEARKEGRDEGAMAALRRSVLRVLQTRFGAVPADAEARLAAVESLERLQELVSVAVVCPDPAAFAAESAK